MTEAGMKEPVKSLDMERRGIGLFFLFLEKVVGLI
jgi:hypothetical protein